MSPKMPQLTRKQLDLVDKGLRSMWFVAIGAALLLSAFVYFLFIQSPHPLGIEDEAEASASARAAGSMAVGEGEKPAH
jgi:hypothetical protein